MTLFLNTISSVTTGLARIFNIQVLPVLNLKDFDHLFNLFIIQSLKSLNQLLLDTTFTHSYIEKWGQRVTTQTIVTKTSTTAQESTLN